MSKISTLLLCCIFVLASLVVHAGPPIVSYNFTTGDTLAPKQGWAFGNPNWSLATVPNTAAVGMDFIYGGSLPNNDNNVQQNFFFPPRDQFWLYYRLYIPANYAHRTDTYLQVPNPQGAGWQVNDLIFGTDDSSSARISGFASDGIYLRNAPFNNRNDIWVGTLRNQTRNNTLVSTVRSTDGTNNKLLAIWTDGYSGSGLGSTVVWEFWPGDYNVQPMTSISDLCVHYSIGNHGGAGPHTGCGPFITSNDLGKYIDIMVRVKFTTASGANDGIISTWLRRQGEQTYSQLSHLTDANIDKRGTDANPSNLVSWNQGYLMGWSNSGYDVDTTFHISNIEFYDTDPFDNTPVEIVPRPPIFVRIK